MSRFYQLSEKLARYMKRQTGTPLLCKNHM